MKTSRKFDPNRHLKPLPPPQIDPSLERISKDTKLYSLVKASEILNEQFDGGFGTTNLKRYINCEWVEGCHYIKVGSSYKIHLEAVKEWAVRDK